MNNNRGVVLMLVIVFSFIMSTLGMTLIYSSGIQEMNAAAESSKARALCLAEAGIERAKMWFQNNHTFPEITQGTLNAVPVRPFGAEVMLESTPAYAQGFYRVRIVPNSPDYYAAYIQNMSGGAVTTGDVGTYVIISSGIVKTGYADIAKSVSMPIRMWYDGAYHFKTPNDAAMPNDTWKELPFQRIMH
jgi:Tfp pilus assembly protein PilX